MCGPPLCQLSYPGKVHRAGVEPSRVLLIGQAPPTGWAPVLGSLGWTRTSNDSRRRINSRLLRFVDLGHLAAEHPNRVPDGDPMQRAKVSVENKHRIHRDHLLFVGLQRNRPSCWSEMWQHQRALAQRCGMSPKFKLLQDGLESPPTP